MKVTRGAWSLSQFEKKYEDVVSCDVIPMDVFHLLSVPHTMIGCHVR